MREKGKIVFVILMALFFLVGCKNRSGRTMPSVLLSEQQMVDVMTDVQIIEGAIAYKKSSSGKTEYLRTRGFDTVFSHHGITDSVFIENMTYYSSEPAVMGRILDSVVARLTVMPLESDIKVNDAVNQPAANIVRQPSASFLREIFKHNLCLRSSDDF